MTALLTSDGWWALVTVLWVLGCLGLLAVVVRYLRQPVEPRWSSGPDPRPPAVIIRRRPPYDWATDGDGWRVHDEGGQFIDYRFVRR